MTEGQRQALRNLVKSSPAYRKSTDLVVAFLNGESIEMPEVDESKTETCVWAAALSDEEVSRLAAGAREKDVSWSRYLRDGLFSRNPVSKPVTKDVMKPEQEPTPKPKPQPVPEPEVSAVEPTVPPKQTLKGVGLPMTEGQRDAVRRCIKESPIYGTAGDFLLAVALDEPVVVSDIDESLNEPVIWQAQVSADVKEILDEVAREHGLTTAGFVRKVLFGAAKNPKVSGGVSAHPEVTAPVEVTQEENTIAVVLPPEPAVKVAETVVSTPKQKKPSGKVFTKEVTLKEAYDMHLLHTHLMGVMPDTLRRFDGAEDEVSTARALEEIADLANLYARITPTPSEFWRTLLRTADNLRLPSSSYHRLLLWAGTLETSRLTMVS